MRTMGPVLDRVACRRAPNNALQNLVRCHLLSPLLRATRWITEIISASGWCVHVDACGY